MASCAGRSLAVSGSRCGRQAERLSPTLHAGVTQAPCASAAPHAEPEHACLPDTSGSALCQGQSVTPREAVTFTPAFFVALENEMCTWAALTHMRVGLSVFTQL